MNIEKNMDLLELIQQERSWNRNNTNYSNKENTKSKINPILSITLIIKIFLKRTIFKELNSIPMMKIQKISKIKRNKMKN